MLQRGYSTPVVRVLRSILVEQCRLLSRSGHSQRARQLLSAAAIIDVEGGSGLNAERHKREGFPGKQPGV
jgi:hypothetical protein